MTERISRELILKVMGILADKDIGCSVQFPISGTDNFGLLRLEKGYTPDAQVYLTTGAAANGDDHLVQHFLHHTATLEEMSAWLRDAGNADGLIKSFTELSGRVDKGFD